MLNKTFKLFSGLKMTIIGGIFLIVSLILMITGRQLLIDPAWVTVIICGFPLVYLAITRLIFEKSISSAMLITIAMIASIIINELFAAGEVAFIMALGALLEDKTVEKAKKGIRELISLAPEEGRKITLEDGHEKESMIPTQSIKKGYLLRVLPGETIPTDGNIISGNTSIDQSIITGESLPVDKVVGDSVFCGTINRFGTITIQATKVGKDSSLQKLIQLVKEAEKNKAPMERIVDRWASWFVPLALIIALLTYIFTQDIVRGVTILVVFCPCALVLATPTSIMAAIGQATKHGIIIKSGEALENMGKVDYVAFDKTGTLTHGNLIVSDIVSFDAGLNKMDLLKLTASVEAHSEHPLGKAIVSYAKTQKLEIQKLEKFKMTPGKGVTGNINNTSLFCGNVSFIKENGIEIGVKEEETLALFRKQGKATILVSNKKNILGILALSDALRSTAKAMVLELKETGTEVVLLTGDHTQTANHFAQLVGIDTVHSELLPAEKVKEIQLLQKANHHVCMIGDGVNDAPALKTANVGVAMGTMGSDMAIDAADIALMGDDISKVPYLKRLSNATVKTIKFNIVLSMVINLIAIILSVMGVLNPITGALVHNIGSVLVVLNAALLYDRDYIKKK